MRVLVLCAVSGLLASAGVVFSAEKSGQGRGVGKKFDRVLTIIFENQNADSVLKDPYMNELSKRGAYLSNYHGVVHPSYPNYLAMTGGSTFGVTDDEQKDLDVSSVADLVVLTFDESEWGDFPVYTVFLGPMVRAGGTDDTKYNHYSLLRTIEDNFELGTLGREDEKAAPIVSIWK
ncbi:MAG: hypothetical protein HY280_11210 [Nitrospinae bacterium]|nr:hypothetical protein [Nitrospinota bacterium]